MNAKTAVLSLVSLTPLPIRLIIQRLPYAPPTIYRSVEELVSEGSLVKTRRGKDVIVEISASYEAQKLKEIHITALSYGIDPDTILNENTLAVWRGLEEPSTVEELQTATGLSGKWVRKVLKDLEAPGLIVFRKRKPMIAVMDADHPLNRLLIAYTNRSRTEPVALETGTTPFSEMIDSPEAIERALHEKIEEGLSVRGTGFLVKGDGDRLNILESMEGEPTVEALFLRRLMTSEGAEDTCIRLITHGKMDYDALLKLAIERDMVNVVGCYLDIINGIRKLVKHGIVERFASKCSEKKRIFQKEEKRYGKNGWEGKYETRWNVDLYLDIGAIRHGVRGV